MSKTRAEVITRALRRLRVIAHNRAATADMTNEVGDVLDSLFDELQETNPVPWQLSAVPDRCFNALADLLAAEVAHEFSKQPPMPRSKAWMRLTQIINPDDWQVQRTDIRQEWY